MSGIGEAASLLTLIKAARVLATTTCHVAKKFKNSPAELTALVAQILDLESELEILKRTVDAGHPALLNDDIRSNILDALIDARDAVAKLNTISTAARGNQSISSKLRWMRREQDANRALAEVRIVREKLHSYMLIVNCRGQSLMLKRIDDLERTVTKDTLQDDAVRNEEENEPADSNSSALFSPKPCVPRKLDSKPWSLGSNWAIFGIKGGFVPTAQGAHKDFFIAMQLSVPLSQMIGPCAFTMSLSVRTFPLCPYKFDIHGSSFALARVVPDHDPFMIACDEGNLIAVRTMLQNGQGSPTDIISRNWTPLAFAIRSGNPDVVKELLKHGASMNATLGVLQTTPLQWAVWHKQLDITRLLLEYGASQDHINGLGWNTTFFCWPILQRGERNMLDFLNVLAEDSDQDLDAADTEGWTVLHRVSGFGSSDEVAALIKLGADPLKYAEPLKWNAMHHAVFYGNYPTFQVLLPYLADLLTMTDERGWTLLHIAASAGHDEIVRHLIRLGANSEARSKPFMSHMPECLFKKACTPQEVAAAQSQEHESKFIEAVREGGAMPSTLEDDSDDELLFEDAKESLY